MTTSIESLRGATLYFDCASGIAGDMTVGALVDLGVPESVVRDALGRLPLGGYRVAFETVMRSGLRGTKFRVHIDATGEHGLAHEHDHAQQDPDHAQHHHDHAHHEHDHAHHEHEHAHHDPDHAHHDIPREPHHHGGAHVHYGAIRRMLEDAPLADGVRARALAIFARIAAVEAHLHGVDVEAVAFHEVGAVDSIVDIVGAAAALDWIAPARVISRRVPLGRGRVRTAHGLLPVPSPAALELLRGAPVEEGGVDGELTTPTGAAILAASAGAWGALPALTLVGVGWGAGDREIPDRPNLLRVVAGHEDRADAGDPSAPAASALHVIEANVDDMSPELAGPLVEALLHAGAVDAWLTPVIMKKGRPAVVISALAPADARDAVERTLLAESTTIGLRRHTVERTTLPRRVIEVATPFGPIPVKVAGDPAALDGPDGPHNAAPEYEACRRAALAAGVPTKRVFAEAIAAYYRR